MSIVVLHAVRPVGTAMLHKMAELGIILLSTLMTHLALCVDTNLFKLMARNKAFAQVRVVDQVEVLCKRLEHLLANITTRVDILRPVALMEGHVKPFHRETCAGLLKVAFG